MSAKEIRIEELASFCNSMARQIMKDHEKRFAERAKSVKEASLGLSNAAARLAAGVKNAWGTLDETAYEYAMRLAEVIQESAQNLSRKDVESSYQDTERFHKDAVQTLNKVIITVRKYIPRLHRGLKTEMAALNGALAKLENSVKALGSTLDESPGLKLESLQRDVQLIAEKRAQLLKLKSEHQRESIALDMTFKRGEALLMEKQALTTGPEFLELKRYEESLASKEDEIRQFLQPLTKPLLKLERTASTKQESSVDVRILRNVVERPVETVATGQPFAVGQLLGFLEEALSRRDFEIEERKRRKAEDTIKAAKQGLLLKMREEYLALQANTQETLRQLRAKGLLEKRDTLDNLLAETQSQQETLKARLRDLQRRIDDLSSSILKEKASLESQISKLSRQSIVISAT